MPRLPILLCVSLALTSGQLARALDIPLDQVVLQLPQWTAMPDRQGETGMEKRAKSPDSKTLVNAWSSTNPKATVEQGVIFFMLPLVTSPEDLRERATTMKISQADVDLIITLAKNSNYPVGTTTSKIEQVGSCEVGARKIYYVLSRPDARGDAVLFVVTQGRTPQSNNTAVFYGPPNVLKNAVAFAKMFRDAKP